MIDVSDFESWRDGGTRIFRIAGCDVDGLYRLQTPFDGLPQPLFCDDVRVSPPDVTRVISVLESWLAARMTPDAVTALSELKQLHFIGGPVANRPVHLLKVAQFLYVQDIVKRLKEGSEATHAEDHRNH